MSRSQWHSGGARHQAASAVPAIGGVSAGWLRVPSFAGLARRRASPEWARRYGSFPPHCYFGIACWVVEGDQSICPTLRLRYGNACRVVAQIDLLRGQAGLDFGKHANIGASWFSFRVRGTNVFKPCTVKGGSCCCTAVCRAGLSLQKCACALALALRTSCLR